MYESFLDKKQLFFKNIKFKIGKNSFKEECKLIKFIINNNPNITFSVDANETFSIKESLKKIKILHSIGIKLIEQPIKRNQWDYMYKLCKESPIPIALDEELNGIFYLKEKRLLLDTIKPKFLVLKPSFCGGFYLTKEWIIEAEKRNIKWWITSAFESNLSLNYICQWIFCTKKNLIHGLDTLNLYKNNYFFPLKIKKGLIFYNHIYKSNLDIIL